MTPADPSLRAGLERLERFPDRTAVGGEIVRWSDVADLLRAQPPDQQIEMLKTLLAEARADCAVWKSSADNLAEQLKVVKELAVRAQPPPAPDPRTDVDLHEVVKKIALEAMLAQSDPHAHLLPTAEAYRAALIKICNRALAALDKIAKAESCPDLCTCGHEKDSHGNDGEGACGATKACRAGGCKQFTLASPPAVEGTRKQQDGESRVDQSAHAPTTGSTAKTTTGGRS